MEPRAKKIVWYVVATLIFGVLVYFANYHKIIDVLFASDLYYVSIAILFGLFTILMWSIVWYRFFGILELDISLRESIQLLLAGLFMNAVTPLGRFGGEPFMAHIIGKNTEANYQQALTGVTSADLSNAIPFATYGVLAIVYLAIFSTLEGFMADITLVMLSIVVFSLFIVYLLWFNGARYLIRLGHKLYPLEKEFGRLRPYIDSGKERGREVLDRLEEVGDQPRKVFWTICVSHLAVVGHLGAIYFAFKAVGVEPMLHSVLLIISLSTVLTFSPTPGSTGTIEAGLTLLIMAFYPISPATATSVAIIYRVATYLPNIFLGYIGLINLKSDLELGSRIRRFKSLL